MKARHFKRAAKSTKKSSTNISSWRSVGLPFQLSPPIHVSDRKDLFEKCTLEERRAKEERVKYALEKAAWFHIFENSLFGKGSEKGNNGHSLRLTIYGPPTKVIRREWRYSELLKHLQTTEDVESRWIFIARWLKDEGICEPEEFLPRQVLRHALKRVRSAITSLSPTAIHYWRLMSIWMKYFELHDRTTWVFSAKHFPWALRFELKDVILSVLEFRWEGALV